MLALSRPSLGVYPVSHATAESGPRLPIVSEAFGDENGGLADYSQNVLELAAAERQAVASTARAYRPS